MFIHASGRLTAPEATFVPDTERQKTYWTARVWLVIYAAIVVACVVSSSILPAMVIGLPRMYGAWHHIDDRVSPSTAAWARTSPTIGSTAAPCT